MAHTQPQPIKQTQTSQAAGFLARLLKRNQKDSQAQAQAKENGRDPLTQYADRLLKHYQRKQPQRLCFPSLPHLRPGVGWVVDEHLRAEGAAAVLRRLAAAQVGLQVGRGAQASAVHLEGDVAGRGSCTAKEEAVQAVLVTSGVEVRSDDRSEGCSAPCGIRARP